MQDVQRTRDNAADMAEQRELHTKIQLDVRRRNMLESGPMRRNSVYDDACPCCKTKLGDTIFVGEDRTIARAWTPDKTHCGGRDPYSSKGAESLCVILGEHLHARCPHCFYTWFERAAFDFDDQDNRGAVRFDEVVRDGKLYERSKLEPNDPDVADPTLKSAWGFDEAPQPGDVVTVAADGKRTVVRGAP